MSCNPHFNQDARKLMTKGSASEQALWKLKKSWFCFAKWTWFLKEINSRAKSHLGTFADMTVSKHFSTTWGTHTQKKSCVESFFQFLRQTPLNVLRTLTWPIWQTQLQFTFKKLTGGNHQRPEIFLQLRFNADNILSNGLIRISTKAMPGTKHDNVTSCWSEAEDKEVHGCAVWIHGFRWCMFSPFLQHGIKCKEKAEKGKKETGQNTTDCVVVHSCLSLWCCATENTFQVFLFDADSLFKSKVPLKSD